MTINGTFYNPLEIGPMLFGWLDYSLFAIMLLSSVVVGAWFGICGRKHNTAAVDYLLGGKTMSIVPVGVSLGAGHVSGITLMGTPADLYVYGVQYGLLCVSAFGMGLIINYIYLPVFYELQITSLYEYLELRFNSSARKMASILFALGLVMYLPICMYVPCLAFSLVSGVSVHLISPVVCFTCIFYTMMGGLKGVVWTDFLQAFVMVGALITVVIIGAVNVGGVGTIWDRNLESGRLDVSFDPSMYVRNSFWTVTVAGTIQWLSFTAISQAAMQKFLSLPTIGSARWALLIFVLVVFVVKIFSSLAGLVIYAAYHECDPITTGAIRRADQLLPYFVMDTAKNIPGLPGLFIAGIFSAALSTMSSVLNSVAGTIYEDFIKSHLSGKMSDGKINLILKTIVVVIGAIGVALIFLVEQLGSVIEVGYSAGGITAGAMLGLFTMGILFPWANAKGALAGSIASLILLSWQVFGTQHAAKTGMAGHPKLPTSVAGCGFNVTLPETTPAPNSYARDEAFFLYRISYMYYCLIGTLIVFVVGLTVSFLTGPRKPEDVDSRLFAPFVRRWVEKKQRTAQASPDEKEMLNMKPVD